MDIPAPRQNAKSQVLEIHRLFFQVLYQFPGFLLKITKFQDVSWFSRSTVISQGFPGQVATLT